MSFKRAIETMAALIWLCFVVVFEVPASAAPRAVSGISPIAPSGAPATPQCTYAWQPAQHGHLDLDGAAYVMVTWDEDGPGPAPESLFVGGSFLLAGGNLTNGIAKWNGSDWLPVGNGFDGVVSA